ncbi:MAG: hypothetical protein H0T73_14665 [Ardenticatenales bacterium]|nr:hypothetical protein [Ardenticatenales bacterium]
MSRAFYLLFLVWLLVALAGCGQGNVGPSTEATRLPESGVTPGTDATLPGTPLISEGTVIEVQLAEYKIIMPPTLPAGPISFEITNAGSMEHNFMLEGAGSSRTFDTPLKPGEFRPLPLELVAGSYQVYCPLADHEGRGMELTLTITP